MVATVPCACSTRRPSASAPASDARRARRLGGARPTPISSSRCCSTSRSTPSRGWIPRAADGAVEIEARAHGADVVISVCGQRPGHPDPQPRAGVRAVLHHQEGGGGDRAGPVDLPAARAAHGRPARADQPRRAWARPPTWCCRPGRPAGGGRRRRPPGGGAGAQPQDPHRRLLVAVVDDEPALLQAMRRVLSDDHEVVTFTEAVEAKEWLLYGPRPDLVLCDIMMPVLSGIDLYHGGDAGPPLAGPAVRVSSPGPPRVPRWTRCSRSRRCALVEKPLERQSLLALCREIAAGPGQHSAAPPRSPVVAARGSQPRVPA